MTDKPISFSGPMVRALRQGRKAQTRRMLKPQREYYFRDAAGWRYSHDAVAQPTFSAPLKLPYAVGDRLYVREHWRVQEIFDGYAPVSSKKGAPILQPDQCAVRYDADGPAEHFIGKMRQAMHMPRWASRLFLVVTEVRVQRLRDISYEDVIAEGVEMESADPPFYYVPGLPTAGIAVGIEEPGGRHAQRCYFNLLDHLHGAGFSARNPWLAAYSFTVHPGNIDRA